MGRKFSKMAITFQGRAVSPNPFRLFTISMPSIKRRMNEGNRDWAPRAVPSPELEMLTPTKHRFQKIHFPTYPWGERSGVNFFQEKKSRKKDLKFTQVYSVLNADSEYGISFPQIPIFVAKNYQISVKKRLRPRLYTSIRWTFLSGHYFFY
jgi:hypothetical protein